VLAQINVLPVLLIKLSQLRQGPVVVLLEAIKAVVLIA